MLKLAGEAGCTSKAGDDWQQSFAAAVLGD